MYNEEANHVDSLDDRQTTYNPDTHFIEKKLTYKKFVLFEFFVFICISAVSFFATYIGTNRFESEELFANNISVYTDFFDIVNIGNTLLGIFIIIGILTTINMISTNLELNLDSLLRRLVHSGIDFVYLMISTFLGFSFATLIFVLNQNPTQELLELKNTLIRLIIMLIGLSIIYIPTFMVLPHKSKISDIKKKKTKA